MSITLSQVTQRTPNLGDRVRRYGSVFTRAGSGVVVHRAVMRGETVIVKDHRYVGHGTEAMKHTLHEAFIWSFLHHENIHPLLGIVTTFDNPVSIVAEYVACVDAHDYVQNPRVDTASLLLGIARALNYLHAHRQGPIFHGDVRGKNVLVTNHGRALLTDFGCSYFHDYSSNTIYSSPLSGALRWMAPEVIESIESNEGGSPTDKGDVWAFAMTVLELSTGKLPFEDIKIDRGVTVRVLRGMPDRPRRMSNEWWDLCTLCWKSDPALRPTMMDLVRRIEMIVTSFRRPQGKDGDEDGDGGGTNEVPISQAVDKMTSTTRLMPDCSKTVTSLSSYCTQPICISI